MRVVCSLPNASHLINGVRFASIEGGMLSEDMSPERAAELFLHIRGFSIFEPPDDFPKDDTPKAPAIVDVDLADDTAAESETIQAPSSPIKAPEMPKTKASASRPAAPHKETT